MTTHGDATERTNDVVVPASLARVFRASVRFVAADSSTDRAAKTVAVEWVALPETHPSALDKDTLPFLAIPVIDGDDAERNHVVRVLVSAEGRDTGIARAIIALLRPDCCAIDLLHVTWLPGVVPSPIDPGGLDDPHPTSLLAFRGAHEALVNRADEFRAAGFAVSTYLRMNRNPEQAIAALARDRRPALAVLGLGRHGAGIGQALMRDCALPTLYVACWDHE